MLVRHGTAAFDLAQLVRMHFTDGLAHAPVRFVPLLGCKLADWRDQHGSAAVFLDHGRRLLQHSGRGQLVELTLVSVSGSADHCANVEHACGDPQRNAGGLHGRFVLGRTRDPRSERALRAADTRCSVYACSRPLRCLRGMHVVVTASA